ncbi:MAG: DedA family protein [Rhodospirillales bacterium]|nr:MAG: DedA family protein [Rhodospirillales bacterium]
MSAGLAFGGYFGLFLSAVLAATLLPLSSEAVLVALSQARGFDVVLLFAVATFGNTVGATVNWALGRYCLRWRHRRWFPVSADQLNRAGSQFQRYGLWSLLFAWMPVIGDPLTFAAGILRVHLLPFLVLVGIGKGARYAAVILLADSVLTSS